MLKKSKGVRKLSVKGTVQVIQSEAEIQEQKKKEKWLSLVVVSIV